MFPSKEEPTSGTFVYELTKSLSYKNNVIVIHPRLWNPFSIKSYRASISLKEAKENGSRADATFHFHQGRRNSPFSLGEKVREASSCKKDVYHDFMNGMEIYRPKLFILPKGDRLFFRAFAFLIVSLPLLRKLREIFRFELIHAQMAGPAGFRKPVIITAQGSDIHTFPKHLFLKQLVIFTLKRATKVVAVSHSLKDLILKMVNMQKKLSIIRNGSRQETFFPIDKIKTRRSLNLTVDKKIILFIGSLIPRKAVDVLLRAFACMNKTNVILLLIGKGDSEPELKALTKELHIETQVYFIGSKNHDEIPVWLNACDVFCLPSHHEGFPTVIVEAFACGRPVVATKVDGVPEAITNDTVGILVEPTELYKNVGSKK